MLGQLNVFDLYLVTGAIVLHNYYHAALLMTFFIDMVNQCIFSCRKKELEISRNF